MQRLTTKTIFAAWGEFFILSKIYLCFRKWQNFEFFEKSQKYSKVAIKWSEKQRKL